MNFTQSIKNSVLTLTISRPAALNALNKETLSELDRLVEEIYLNKEVSGVILTGEGEKAFVAGADIKEFTSLDGPKALELAKTGQRIFKKIEDCPKPIMAAVNGFALGGGCELALACHMRIATENARFGQPEVNLGIIPGYGGTQRLTQLVGRGKALELMLTGDVITAQEAKMIGLVNHVVGNREELMALANKIMATILSKAPIAVAGVIKSVNAGFQFEGEGYKAELSNFAACASTRDFTEGAAAFIEKRKPVFKGE
jgi:enoyl-CoA hydratase